MTITYQLTQQDFYESFIAHRNSRKAMKWMIRILLAFLAFCILTDITFFLTDHLQGSLTSALIPPVGLAVFWMLLLWLSPRWTARNQFRKQPSVQGPRTLTLDTQGANWQWDGGHAEIEWKNLIRYYEAKNQFLIYSSPACFNIVPKRSLSSEELSELREFFVQNIRVVK